MGIREPKLNDLRADMDLGAFDPEWSTVPRFNPKWRDWHNHFPVSQWVLKMLCREG